MPTANVADQSITVYLPYLYDVIGLNANVQNFGYIVLLRSQSTGQWRTNYMDNFEPVIIPPKDVPGGVLQYTSTTAPPYTFGGLDFGSYEVYIWYYNTLKVDNVNSALIYPVDGLLSYFASSYESIILSSPDPNTGCTDSGALNYNPTADIDDGTCKYESITTTVDGCMCPDGSYDQACCPPDPVGGCTDITAENYKPFAHYDDGSCKYNLVGCVDCDANVSTIPACIPDNIEELLAYSKKCIAKAGTKYHVKQITGMPNKCEDMNFWKVVLISKLMAKKGLPCLYNCTDSETPDINLVTVDCNAEWNRQGAKIWAPNQVYYLGAVIQHKDVIYKAVSNAGLGYDPKSLNPENGWSVCKNVKTIHTEPYMKRFLEFLYTYCKECGIKPYYKKAPKAVNISESLTIGGIQITANGQPL